MTLDDCRSLSPDLPTELYCVESFRRLGNLVGKTLKIDRTTAFSEKGGFVRICFEVDLQKPLLLGFDHFGKIPVVATVDSKKETTGNQGGVNAEGGIFGPYMILKRDMGKQVIHVRGFKGISNGFDFEENAISG
ncbi:hypothetical protein K1719_032044 [Acacia pycnantha]|nr:hypothetical protein K1719_032044 [Acacia pycnantha]